MQRHLCAVIKLHEEEAAPGNKKVSCRNEGKKRTYQTKHKNLTLNVHLH
jgi:hypothetical protein